MAKGKEIWDIYNQLYKGKWVRISIDGQTRLGVMDEAKYEYISLLPSVIIENLSLEDKTLELRLEKDIPMIISMPIRTIEPISENFVRKFLKEYSTKNDNQEELLF